MYITVDMTKKHLDLSLQKELLIAQGEVLRLTCQTILENYQSTPAFFTSNAWRFLCKGVLGAWLVIKVLSQQLPNRPAKQFIKAIFHATFLWRIFRKIWQHHTS